MSVTAITTAKWDWRATQEVLYEVRQERERQHAKWGQQDVPIVPVSVLNQVAMHGLMADTWKSLNDQRVQDGDLAWDGIVLEEVYEAFAETDLEKARAELVQPAATCVAAIEAIDRRSE